jgi:hypothetical protein
VTLALAASSADTSSTSQKPPCSAYVRRQSMFDKMRHCFCPMCNAGLGDLLQDRHHERGSNWLSRGIPVRDLACLQLGFRMCRPPGNRQRVHDGHMTLDQTNRGKKDRACHADAFGVVPHRLAPAVGRNTLCSCGDQRASRLEHRTSGVMRNAVVMRAF